MAGFLCLALGVNAQEGDEDATLIYASDFENEMSGGIPMGWVTYNDAGFHLYGLNEDGSQFIYDWGGNPGGGGSRLYEGFSGDFTKALYWGSRGTTTEGYAEFGSLVKDYIMEDGSISPNMPEGIALELDSGEYHISFQMAAWREEPTFYVTLFDLDYTVQDTWGEFVATPNMEGAMGEVTGTEQHEITFSVDKSGYYILRFTAAEDFWQEYLLVSVQVWKDEGNQNHAADWQEGQDVTAELGLGDCDGSFSGEWENNTYQYGYYEISDLGDYWKGEVAPNEYVPNEGNGGVIAFYAKPNFDIYQVAKFPAGIYTIRVQSFYREGNPNDTFTNYNKGQVKKNCYLYADILASKNASSEVQREVNTVIRSMATSEQETALYTNGEVTWMNDGNNKITNAEGERVTVYYPSCTPAIVRYFAEDRYWNEIKIVLLEDSWIRLGLRKVGSISEDWLPFSNLQVIYQGQATEDDQLEAAQDDAKTALIPLEEYMNTADDAGFTGFAGAISNLIMDLTEKIDGAGSVAELDAVLQKIEATIDEYSKTMISINSLGDLVEMSEGMMASTNFPGLATFKTAYEKAVADAKTDDVDALGENPGEYFDKVYTELAAARAAYLDTQEKDAEGAKDFTALIKHPWFVNPEFNPTQKEDGTWSLDEETWQDVGNPTDYGTNDGARTDISSEVELAADASANNQWFKRLKTFGDGWSANSYHLYYQAHLIGVSQGWSTSYDDWEGVCQQLVGLPNGYYSLKGLVRGNLNDSKYSDDNLPPYHNIFAENSEEVRVSSVVGHADGYYCQQILGSNNGWYEWQAVIWQEHKTGTVQVNDGKLLIGGQSSITGNFTGFRLMFYGTNPPFDKMIQKEMDEINDQKDALLFAGDKKAVDDILAAIKLPLTSADAYDAAIAVTVEARDFISKAQGGEKKFNATKTYEDLLDQYTSDDASAIISPAYNNAVTFGEADTDTYEGVEALNAQADKYAEYMAAYDKAKGLDDAILKDAVAKQETILKASAKGESVETLDKFMSELALPSNITLFQELGAGEATATSPVNVTSLIANPSFDNSPTEGWSCTETASINEYGRGNSELWNKAAFTFSQKLAGLPAGTYELRAKAIYRDGGSVTADLVKAFQTAGNEEAWENHNAELFAKASDENDQFVYVKAIESLKGTANSFEEVVTAWDEEDNGDGTVNRFPTTIQTLAAEGEGETVASATYEHKKQGDYPFDTQIEIDGVTYFYPSSMYGFYQWCQTNPDAVTNKVQITIADGDALEVGLRHTKAIGSDWVIFDDFELYYLTGDVFKQTLTGIAEVKAPAKGQKGIYNTAGQRVDKSYKGIIIVDGVKKLNK